MNIFAQAQKNLPLTPAQRAFLKLLEMLAIDAVVSGLQAAAMQMGAGTVNASDVLHTFAIGAVVAFLATYAKYYKSHADGPLLTASAAVADQAAQAIESANPTLYNRAEAGTPPAAPASVTVTAATANVLPATVAE